MESIFPVISIPPFQDVQISDSKSISTKFLYLSARKLFKGVYSNFCYDEAQKKRFTSRSSFTNFLRDFAKTQRPTEMLRVAKIEWDALDAERKELYRMPTDNMKKLKNLKRRKKARMVRSSYSFFVEIKCKKRSRPYDVLANKWNLLSESRKVPYRVLAELDKERAAFEHAAFSRLELTLRLLSAASSKKLIKKWKGSIIYKEELKESLRERGFPQIPMLKILGRKKYARMDKEVKNKYIEAAQSRNNETFEQLFAKVIAKANIFFGEMLDSENQANAGSGIFEEDFDGFCLVEDTGFNI